MRVCGSGVCAALSLGLSLHACGREVCGRVCVCVCVCVRACMWVWCVCMPLSLGRSLQACGREVCGQVCAVQNGFGAGTGGCGFLVLCSVDGEVLILTLKTLTLTLTLTLSPLFSGWKGIKQSRTHSHLTLNKVPFPFNAPLITSSFCLFM